VNFVAGERYFQGLFCRIFIPHIFSQKVKKAVIHKVNFAIAK